MTDKTLRTLAIVAVVMIALSFVVGSSQPRTDFKFNSGQLLIPNFDPVQVQSITVASGEDSVSLKRQGRGYLVGSLRNYPAANKEVNRLITDVLGIRCASKVSSDPDTYAELGVADGSDESTVVTFAGADGNPLLAVYVGKSVEGGSGKYVRVGSSNDVYRSEEWVSLRTKGMDFVKKDLVSLQRDDIAKVSVGPEGTAYVIDSPEKGEIALQSIPEGKKAKGKDYETVFGAATYLSFTDFKSEVEAKDLTFASVYVVETRDGAEYRFEIAKQDGEAEKWWVRCRARYVGPSIGEIERQLQTEKLEDEALKQNEAYVAANNSTVKFTEQHQSWVYEISSWKAENMTKKLDDLLEDDDGKPSEVQVSHILIQFADAERADDSVTRTKDEARAEAERLLAEVTADPSKFAEIATESSDGPSASKGGDLGMVSKGSGMAPEFEAAALSLLNVGDISPIVETSFGFHIIKRTK